MANNIVSFRDTQGRFTDRKQLKKVARLGPKAFEQSAGFLRISDGDNPLDKSGVHPETYPVVEAIIKQLNLTVDGLFSNSEQLKQVNISEITNDNFGEVTINDIIKELEKPSRDPRPEFKTATFAEGVTKIADLNVGMVLEGIISNVANFGAFVDIGVHQDGLVHISAITDKFIKDPREFVKAGDIVKVKVLEVDVQRKRIALTMRLNEQASQKFQTASHKSKSDKSANKFPPIKQVKQAKQHSVSKSSANKPSTNKPRPKKTENAAMGNAFADAFAKLKK